MRTATVRATLVAAVLLTACRESATDPGTAVRASLAVDASAACPPAPTFVVSDEVGLLAALGAAQAGDVIALDGFFPVGADVNITTEGLRLTCATLGSGLFVQPGTVVAVLVNIVANGVTIDHLVLDAGSLFTDPVDVLAADVQFLNNAVRCGGLCLIAAVAPRVVVAENHFEAAGAVTGVHLQAGVDGARIQRNRIVAIAPSGVSIFGGIHVRDGHNVLVTDNIVQGPWSNSIAPANLTHSQFASNHLQGARFNGIQFTGAQLFIENVFRGNSVTDADSAGILVRSACRNSFVNNDLNGNGGNIGAVFAVTTGANILVSPLGTTNEVIDNGGTFDCNGDGVGDPNIITGPGSVLTGVPFRSPGDVAAGSLGRLR